MFKIMLETLIQFKIQENNVIAHKKNIEITIVLLVRKHQIRVIIDSRTVKKTNHLNILIKININH